MTDKGISNIDVVIDILMLSEANNLTLHIYMDIGIGFENEPVALKTKLCWVFWGERQNNNKYPNINAFSKKFDPENINSKFWHIESYGVLEKQKPKHFTTNETTCFKHLRKNYNKH